MERYILDQVSKVLGLKVVSGRFVNDRVYERMPNNSLPDGPPMSRKRRSAQERMPAIKSGRIRRQTSAKPLLSHKVGHLKFLPFSSRFFFFC